MKELGPSDIHHLRAAQGWLGLGDLAAAIEESLQIELQLHPLVVITRGDVFRRGRKWDVSLRHARAAVILLPEDIYGWLDGSLALNRMGRTQEAYNFLLPAAKRFPKNDDIPYNLACYSTLLGRLDEGLQWLRWAVEVGDPQRNKSEALVDPDLEPLRARIAEVEGAGRDGPLLCEQGLSRALVVTKPDGCLVWYEPGSGAAKRRTRER